MVSDPSPDFPELKEKTRHVWDRIAEWWDDRIGDGNIFQDFLIEPTTERMLDLKPGEQVLDIACGAGRFARRMAALGAYVTAIDHSERFIQRARQRTRNNVERIDYRVLDASDPHALLALGEGRFDAAVCTMALMDMASISPLLSTLPRLLKSEGRFVFSVTHPVFNSGNARRIAEEIDRDGKIVTTFGVLVTDYAIPYVHMGISIRGQPEPQYYFHRPVSLLLNTCFKFGFTLDWIEEPTHPEINEARPETVVSWDNYHSIPPVLVARMRLKTKRL